MPCGSPGRATALHGTEPGRPYPRRSRAKSSPAVPVRGRLQRPILIPPATRRQPKLRACIACPRFCRASISIATGSSPRPKLPWSAPRGGAPGWMRSGRPTSGFVSSLALRSGIESGPGATASGRHCTSSTIVAGKLRSFEHPFFLPATTADLRVTNHCASRKCDLQTRGFMAARSC